MDAPTPPSGPRPPDGSVDPPVDGPLSREQAVALLDRAAGLLADGEPAEAGRLYQRVIGHRDADITAAGLLGFGECLARLDREADAIEAWETIHELPPTPSTYLAWRNIAAARVRSGELRRALAAYTEADRLAPPEDKPEIASRLGWLSKELGDAQASRRWFARARGEGIATPVTFSIIGLTAAISLAGLTSGPAGAAITEALWLDKAGVADGEYWRLWSVTLVHGSLLHLFFNMYALWLAGTITERFYGSATYLLMYLLCAAAGSVASFVFGGDIPSVGASGAVFGMFGVLLAAMRAHDPMVDRRTRSILVQLGPLVAINLVLGFLVAGIDNAAHIGGLLAGIWLGALMVPTGIPTLTGAPDPATGTASWRTSRTLRWAGVLALVVVLLVGLVIGTRARGGTGPDGLTTVDQPSSPSSSSPSVASLSSIAASSPSSASVIGPARRAASSPRSTSRSIRSRMSVSRCLASSRSPSVALRPMATARSSSSFASRPRSPS
jgi:rhomboid protease GluP